MPGGRLRKYGRNSASQPDGNSKPDKGILDANQGTNVDPPLSGGAPALNAHLQANPAGYGGFKPADASRRVGPGSVPTPPGSQPLQGHIAHVDMASLPGYAS